MKIIVRFLRFSSASLALILAVACGCASHEPVPITYGQDTCDYCRMSIVDQRFGTELLTIKGKAFKFDSIECLAAYARSGKISSEKVHSRWITDFRFPSELMSASDATYVHTVNQRSPMGLGLFGFSTKAEAESFADEVGGELLTWDQIEILVEEKWLK